jgi:MOSC domain-containing protein YiiM
MPPGRANVGQIVQLNTSPGGVPKRPVAQAHVDALGLAGDDHDDLVHHGGPERAVSLFAIERIEALAAEGHPIAAGSVGENVTTRGLDWDAVQPGARLRLGPEVVVEITSFAAPCRTIRASFREGGFNRISQKLFPGWSRAYARVIATGVVRSGDAIELLDGHPEAPPGPASGA